MVDLEYVEIDGLLYPNIQLDDAEAYDDLGKYGSLRLNFLHEQKPQQYRELLLTGKLAPHCAEIEQSAFEMAERVRRQYHRTTPCSCRGYRTDTGFYTSSNDCR